MSKFEEYKNSNEYRIWGNLREVCESLNISQNSISNIPDIYDYWEPFLERLFKLGVQYKQTGKLKEIKMKWIRPIFFVQSESKVYMDGKVYEPPKESIDNAQEVHRKLLDLLFNIYEFPKLEQSTLKKLRKDLQDTSSQFFKSLIKFVLKKGYRDLNETLKEIMKPLRELRKSCFNLFLLEGKHLAYEELTFFNDKKDFKLFTDSIKEQFKEDEFKLKRDNDPEKLEEYLNKNQSKVAFEYEFNEKKRENYHFEVIKFRKEALQQKFEEGIDAFLRYLYDKVKEQFYMPIDVHKMFFNINFLKNNNLIPMRFYADQLIKFIEEMKIMLYEMKINRMSRIRMPLSHNTEIIEKVREMYDTHIILENLMGDKLKYDQYVFFYNCVKLIHDSNIAENLFVFKIEGFIEKAIPQYIIFTALRESVKVMENMRKACKEKEEKFSIDKFYQLSEMQLDSENNIIINALYLNDNLAKFLTDDLKQIQKKLEQEIQQFGGRFWLLEGLFPAEDKDLWLEAVEILRNINNLVQDDIRDFILTTQDKSKNLMDDYRQQQRRHSRTNSIKKAKDSSLSPNVRKGGKKRTNKSNKDEKSFESEDESMIRNRQKVPIKLDGLRPPNVWNFPIHKLKRLNKEEEKIEIRTIDPSNTYVDGRVPKFLEVLKKITERSMAYCEQKGDVWRYRFRKVLAIFQNKKENILEGI